MKLPCILLAIVGSCGVLVGAAKADTLFTGVLSPDAVRLVCDRAGANFSDYGAGGYGCHDTSVMISCRASLDCISKVRDLNSYLGNTLAAYMRQHGMRQVDPVSRPYSD